MRTRIIAILAAAVAALAPTAGAQQPANQTAQAGQRLSPAQQIVWPQEFYDPRGVSCRQFHAARAGYMAKARPQFHCTKGVDCPQDMAPAKQTQFTFPVYYEYVDPAVRPIDVRLSHTAIEIVASAAGQLLGDLDKVARSKKRTIAVEGYSDVANDEAFRKTLGLVIAACLQDLVEVSLHLNGYADAYDFTASATVAEGPGNRPNVREPRNRKTVTTITY